MQTQLVTYVRNRKGQPVGAVVAERVHRNGVSEIYVSGSLCHSKKDVFNKERSVELALDRISAMAAEGRACKLPHSLRKHVEQMKDRAKRYFKDSTLVEPVKS